MSFPDAALPAPIVAAVAVSSDKVAACAATAVADETQAVAAAEVEIPASIATMPEPPAPGDDVPPAPDAPEPPAEDGAQFTPATKVWAKVRGFPWWPGQIMSEEMVPSDLKANPRPPKSLPVFFFGTHDYTYVREDDLKPYDALKNNQGAVKRKMLARAIKESANPMSLEEFFRSAAAARQGMDSDADEDDDEEEEEVEEPRAKKRKGTRESLGGELSYYKKRKAKAAAETDDSSADGAESSGAKKKRIGRRKTTGSTGSAIVVLYTPKPDAEKVADPERLLALRYKLQKIFLGETIREAEFAKVDAIMSELETFPVTVDTLRDSKIGKVVRRISSMKIPDEPAKVVARCLALMEHWKTLFLNTADESKPAAAVTTTTTTSTVSVEATSSTESLEQKMSDHVDSTVAVAVATVEKTQVETTVTSAAAVVASSV